MNSLTLQIIANLFNFALFVWVLVKFALPAVKKVLADRHEATMAAIGAAEQAKLQASQALEATQARLAGSEAEFARLLEQAKQIAAAQATAIEENSRQEAERLKAAATAEISRERQSAIEAIRRLTLQQAFERAKAELQQQMNPERQRELVSGMIQKVGDGSLALK